VTVHVDQRVIVRDAVRALVALGVAAVFGRLRCLAVHVNVESQDSAEEILRRVLPVAALVLVVPVLDVARSRVVRTATVAGRYVEIAVGTERDRTRIVVELGLRDLEKRPLGIGIGRRVLLVCGPELREDERVIVLLGGALPRWRTVPDEKSTVLLELGVERESEQTALVEVLEFDELVRDVEERLLWRPSSSWT